MAGEELLEMDCGLDVDLSGMLPGDPSWTQEQYINLVLQFRGSSFTVGEMEEDLNMAATPESPAVMAAIPEASAFLDVTPVFPAVMYIAP